MNKIRRYVLPAVIVTVAIGTPKISYGNTGTQVVIQDQNTAGKMEISEVEFVNKSNGLRDGHFLLGDFKDESESIGIKFTGKNFKDISKVKLIGGDRNQTFILVSSKDEVKVNDTFTSLNVDLKGAVKKEIYGKFLDESGYKKEDKNTGKYYFQIETVSKLVDANGKETLKTETINVDRKHSMDIFDTMKVRGTTPSDRYSYFNPEDLKLRGIYYIRIDFDSDNTNFNTAKYKKLESSTSSDFFIDQNATEHELTDLKVNIKGESINKVDTTKPLMVRGGSVYIPLKDKLEDGLSYEVEYIDDFFMDGELKKQLNSETNYGKTKEELEKEVKKLENEILEIEAKLAKDNLTQGERNLLEKELKDKKALKIVKENALDLETKRAKLKEEIRVLDIEIEEIKAKLKDANLKPDEKIALEKELKEKEAKREAKRKELEALPVDTLGSIAESIKSKLTRTKYKFSFSVNALPVVEKQFEGFVPENYSTNYPILLTGKDFNYDMEVEFYGDGDRYYLADEVRIEDGGIKAYVYLPNRRKLRPGLYDIILRNRNGYDTEVKYGVLSVVKEGDEVPNTDYFVKDDLYEGRLIGLRGKSEDVLELKERLADRSYLEIDLDEVLGPDAWTKTIDYSVDSSRTVSELKLKSSLFDVTVNNLRRNSYGRDDYLKLSVGRATPYVVETFKVRMRNYSVKSDFIEVNGENFTGDFYKVSIPYKNSDGVRLKIVRYDEDLRIFEELSSSINAIDGRVEGISTKPGIFVVVE